MGGKRPDQHNIAPSEAGSTDYKRYPQTGRGDSSDLDNTGQDRQNLAKSRENAKESGVPVPGAKPAPSKHVAEGEKLQADQAETPREREARGTADPRDRGVGA